jgi:D-alanyl-D-alanine carboxypeptidase
MIKPLLPSLSMSSFWRLPRRHSAVAAYRRWWVLIAFAFLLGACTDDDKPLDVYVDPGYSDPALQARLQTGLEAWQADHGLKGAAIKVISPRGQFQWSSNVGVLKEGESTPYTTSSVTRIGSVTKSMTAVVILQLVDEGLLSLNTPLSDFINYPDADKITVELLLRHRSGIYDVTLDDFRFISLLVADSKRWFSPEEILSYTVPGEGPVKSEPISSLSVKDAAGNRADVPRGPACRPNECYHYSQPGFVALGMIIERVTGKPLAQVYRERIWGPLGMTNTRLAGRDEAHDPVTYTNLFGLLGNSKIATTAIPGVGSQPGSLNSNNSVGFSAGGVISNVDDITTYFRALINGDLLNSRQFKKLTDWKVSFPEGFGLNFRSEYGLGFTRNLRTGYEIIGHNGSVAGSGATMQYIPEFDAYIVATRNTDLNSYDSDRNFPDLVDRVKRALKGETQDYPRPTK